MRLGYLSYGGARERAAIPDPHFVLTVDAYDYLGAHMAKNPALIDIASVAPERRTVGHHVRRAAYVSASCVIAVGALAIIAVVVMVAAYLAVHHR